MNKRLEEATERLTGHIESDLLPGAIPTGQVLDLTKVILKPRMRTTVAHKGAEEVERVWVDGKLAQEIRLR